MGRPKGGTNKKHSAEEKLAIVLRYLNDHESMKELQKQTGISHGQISNWVRIYQQEGPEGLQRKRGGNPFAALHASKSLTEVERLRLENFKLTLENERLKKGYQVKGVGETRSTCLQKQRIPHRAKARSTVWGHLYLNADGH